MPRVLLVDDDSEQLEVRRMLFEQAGHETYTAEGAGAALELFDRTAPQLVVTDLRLPETEQGLKLIRALRQRSSDVKIVVLSGWTSDLEQMPEAKLVDEIMGKPARTNRLLAFAAKLSLWILAIWSSAAVPMAAAELAADLEISSSRMERVEILLGEAPKQYVMAYPGYCKQHVQVFFSIPEPSAGRIALRHSPAIQARVLKVREVTAEDPYYLPLANAPILYARAGTIESMSDAPVLAYCERLGDSSAPLLQYTIIFTNEDGGTSTRGLMARWGRTTDIEYVYRAYLKPDGTLLRATIQGRGHKETAFQGRREGAHPLLTPVTLNNMVSAEAASRVRFQLAPQLVDLTAASRELVMDHNWFVYRVAAQELEREGKIRPFGVADGEKISDPRNYLYLEASIANRNSAIAALVRLRGENRLRSSHLGRPGFAIERDGWIRTAIELPPGTAPAQVASIGFECLVAAPSNKDPLPDSGICHIGQVSKAFFLGADYRPGESFFRMQTPVDIPAGEIVEFPVR